jgi:hypothetical protein
VADGEPHDDLELGNPLRPESGRRSLFESPNLRAANNQKYDAFADGQRYVMLAPDERDEDDTAPPAIRVVLNWYGEFRELEQ